MVRRIFLLVASLALASLTFAQNPQSKIKFLRAGSSNGIAVHQVTHKSRMVTTRGHRSQRATARSRLTAAQNRTLKSPTIKSLLSALAPLPEYSLLGTVDLAPSSPLLTAVDPFANHPSPNDPLKPARPFWYSVDKTGFTILGIGDNVVFYTGTWPTTIDIIQPDGSFVTANMPAAGWEPVAMTVSYPTEEALASNSETPATYLYVLMARSGYEWQSNPTPDPLAGRDPNLRDTIVPSTNPATESSLLIQVDVTDPTYDPVTYPTGPTFAGALAGHAAGQPSFDPGTGSVYVPSMPSTSLPTTPAAPVDLTSFVSVIAEIVAPEAAGGEAPGAPVAPIILPLESPDVLPNTPLAWPFLAEGGEGPFVWEFQNLPSWLTAHADKITHELDGIVYGTVPASGSWTFQARVTDLGQEPPIASEWTDITMTANAAAEEQLAGELPFEAGAPNAIALQGTGSCTTGPTASPGSIVPAWIDVVTIPGGINPAQPSEPVIGCVVAGTAPISGEHYEFTMPGFKFAYPWDREPILYSGNVAGAYVFDPLPPGVGLSGLAWHEIDKIHDASTEADILNAEFFGVEPFTGQLYQIVLPQGSLEVSGATAPPEISVEPDNVIALGDPLAAPLAASRTDIADALTANPTLKVRFEGLVVNANRDPSIFVTASQIADPTGADPTVIPIGGPAGSTIPDGALMKVSGTRDGEDATIVTLSAPTTINLPGMQAFFAALDSDLSPAVRGEETGQRDHGALWVTGTNTGNVAVVDTSAGSHAQTLAVTSATALGSVSCDFGTQSAYVAGKLLQNVTIFGTGGPSTHRSPKIWSAATGIMPVGLPGSFIVKATGSPTPEFSYTGTLPSGVAFVDNHNGTATLAGTPAVGTEGDYALTIKASNGVPPEASQSFTLTVATPPAITSAAATTFTVSSAGTFTVTATGGSATVIPALTVLGTLPAGVTFADNEDGTGTLAGTPPAGTQGVYPLIITASIGAPPDAVQNFILTVDGPPLAPAITSASTTTFGAGSPGSFTVTATGWPTPTLSETGALPGGVTFTDNGNGTATLAGTPAAGGSFPFTITATSTAGSVTQNFTLTVTGSTGPATLVSPAPGSTLTGNTVTFTWTNVAATAYQLWIGSTSGAYDLGLIHTTGVSATFSNLPTNGATLYVKLCTLAGGTWTCNDYTYTAATIAAATIATPTPGSTLTGSTATFTWAAATGATSYQIWVGTTQGAYDVGVFSTAGLSATFSNLPTNGATLYVKLCTLAAGAWTCNDYTYTAATMSIATIATPAAGSTLTGNTATFTWNAGTGATSYQIWIGTSSGAHDLGVISTTGLSATFGDLPMNGATLYVKLCTLAGGTWACNDYTYTAATVSIATIATPAPGSTLTGGTATFTWTAATGATSYQIWVGSTAGAYDLGVFSTADLSATFSGLPTNGSTLFVRICTLTGGVWYFNDYTYTTGP